MSTTVYIASVFLYKGQDTGKLTRRVALDTAAP